MKIKNILLAIAATAVVAACHNGQQPAASTDDTLLADDTPEEVVDTTPMPMFLYYHNPDNMQVVFWISLAKPDEPDANWDLQQRTRSIAAQYTKLLLPTGKFANVKFIGEQTKDPDGGDLEVFALHHDYAPSAGLNYAIENTKEDKAINYGGTMLVLVTDEYLESHKTLAVKDLSSRQKNMPKTEVKKLEKQYGMKAIRSTVTSEFDGGYSFGSVQFKPKGDKVLALDVLACGDSVYSIEEWGHYDNAEGPTWNVDDGGEYLPSHILAAFEGPNGIDLCYIHGAPESTVTGWMTLRNGQFEDFEVGQFYNWIDEPMPFWKKDLAKLQKILEKHDPMFKNIKMTKWTYVWIDNDDVREIWLHSDDEEYGAIFSLKGEPQLLCTEQGNNKARLYQGAVVVSGGCGSGCFNMEVVTLKDSRKGDRLELMRNTAPDNSVSSEEYRLNGKIIDKSEGEKFIQQATKQEHYL
ncbi:MAG: hypothetical protein J6W45_08560, partial [Bacteroidales bacterium]|nr:hypothetical protein [Bacteroidales bacterium]